MPPTLSSFQKKKNQSQSIRNAARALSSALSARSATSRAVSRVTEGEGEGEEVEAVLAVLPEIIGRARRGKLPASGV